MPISRGLVGNQGESVCPSQSLEPPSLHLARVLSRKYPRCRGPGIPLAGPLPLRGVHTEKLWLLRNCLLLFLFTRTTREGNGMP